MQKVTSLFEQYVKLCQSLNYETMIAAVRMEDPAKLTDTIAANLRLSTWSFDDSLRPVRGQPTTVLVRDNGLDTRASAMLDAVRSFRPNLVKS